MSMSIENITTDTAKAFEPFIFPYHVGPVTQHFTSALLYSSKLSVSMPAWPMDHPIRAFQMVLERAEQRQHALLPLLSTVDHHFEVTQIQAIAKMKELEPLRGRMINVMTAYPATEEQYSLWEGMHDPCLRIAHASLNDSQILNSATTDFIFRIYELALEQSDELDEIGDDPDSILETLSRRAERLGDDVLLLAESALNRYSLPRWGIGEYFTNAQPAADILSFIGKQFQTDVNTSDLRTAELSFLLFDQLISSYAPPLHYPHIEQVAELMDKKGGELERMRKKCRKEAEKLVDAALPEDKLNRAFKDSIETLREEVSDIAQLDRKAFHKLVNTLLEDKVAWTTVAGLAGALLAPVPAAVAASLALTAFSILGASAFKARREKLDALKDSPWSLVYFLKTLS